MVIHDLVTDCNDDKFQCNNGKFVPKSDQRNDAIIFNKEYLSKRTKRGYWPWEDESNEITTTEKPTTAPHFWPWVQDDNEIATTETATEETARALWPWEVNDNDATEETFNAHGKLKLYLIRFLTYTNL